MRLAVLLVDDVGTAEEVAQDAFVAMHGQWGRLDDNALARAYLRQTVVNRSRSVLRHRDVVKRHLRNTASRALETAPDADTGALTVARRSAVLSALGRLPDRQREVLVLRYYLHLSEEVRSGDTDTAADRPAVQGLPRAGQTQTTCREEGAQHTHSVSGQASATRERTGCNMDNPRCADPAHPAEPALPGD